MQRPYLEDLASRVVPELCEDPKNASTSGLYTLHHRSIRVQN